MDKKILIIIGMHRSGTSLVGNWLSEMNLKLGSDLLGAGIGNIKGHFEDRDFHDLHESIFRKNKIEYGGLNLPLDIELDIIDRIAFETLITKKSNENNQWGWKEPRTCLFLDVYKELIPNANYMVVFRNCSEVVDSLIRREIKRFDNKYPKKSLANKLKYLLRKKKYHQNIIKFNREKFIQTWVHYNRKILNLISNLEKDKFIVIDYMKLLQKDENIYQILNSKWGFDLSYCSISEIYDSNLLKQNVNIMDDCLREEVLEINNLFNSLM